MSVDTCKPILCHSTHSNANQSIYSDVIGVACMENGITIQSEKRSGWRNRGGRGRDRHAPDRMGPPDPFESDESVSDDAMDIDNHIVNPNEF